MQNTLKLWGNGAITLPKNWRDRFPTKLFLAEETKDGNLLIKPIVDVEYYEQDDGSFGLRFPMGMDAEDFLDTFTDAEKAIEKKSKKRRR